MNHREYQPDVDVKPWMLALLPFAIAGAVVMVAVAICAIPFLWVAEKFSPKWQRSKHVAAICLATICLSGCATKPTPPPLPNPTASPIERRTATRGLGGGEDVSQSLTVATRPGISLPLPPVACTVKAMDAQFVTLGEWAHDPNVYSPNVVVDDSRPNGALFIGTK